jgi:threonine aldolase
MELVNKYPTCDCPVDHHYFTCECGCPAFHLNAAKKLICPECHNVFDLSKVLAMIKDNKH